MCERVNLLLLPYWALIIDAVRQENKWHSHLEQSHVFAHTGNSAIQVDVGRVEKVEMLVRRSLINQVFD